jgi:hypothetical protein
MLRALLLTAAALLASPAAAQAHAERWASPDSTLASGDCAASAPCSLDFAVHGASDGETVVVSPGVYGVTTPLDPSAVIDITGVAGQPRPRLVGAATLTGATMSFKTGGTLRHLRIDATAADQDPLTMQGGAGESLLLSSASGDGAKIVGSPEWTVLRDSVVRTLGDGEGSAGLKLREAGGLGNVKLVNVTVMAPRGGAVGVRCEVRAGEARILNSIVRGAAGDIQAKQNGVSCTAGNSNFRAAASPGVLDGLGNQEGEPLFVDGARGDYRTPAGSPTIDAGTTDAPLGPSDAAGCARTLGTAPDIGAFEHGCATAIAEPLTLDAHQDQIDQLLAAVADPEIGESVVVGRAQGEIRVRRPGSSRFKALDDVRQVPVGSVVDAREGRVRLLSAIDGDGTVQMGRFWGARFVVRQGSDGDGMTTLALRGGRFASCGAGASSRIGAGRRRVVRRLWARDRRGRFRTHGHNSVATARGTAWVTKDRCDGTLTVVKAGAVSVRDKRRGKTVLVEAGERYLARR